MRSTFIFLFCFSAALTSCSQEVETKELPTPNPTKYLFNHSITEVQNAIVYALSDFKYQRRILYFLDGKFKKPLDTIELFDQPGNSSDFYLTANSSKFFYGKSKIYCRNGQPLDYVVSFHIHLTAIDEFQTQVEIITIKPRVVLGETAPRGPHLKSGLEYMAVVPSTIEEYEILFEIGKILQENSMPQINYPK